MFYTFFGILSKKKSKLSLVSKMSINISVATEEDIDSILELTNDAFMADAFFKKPKYHLRFDKETVIEMMSGSHAMFLIASRPTSDGIEKVGSMFMSWSDNVTDDTLQVSLTWK